ncbi:unnamed protein product [Rangifer tarandus platyrhynchus]|uniref:Uncharacterized protein n=1 Tax=Rangifer tarandus platyrhynchus TaxID=3082113 RepID=A0AC59ZDB9_RANTA
MRTNGTQESEHSRKFPPAGRLQPISIAPARHPTNRDSRFTRRERGGILEKAGTRHPGCLSAAAGTESRDRFQGGAYGACARSRLKEGVGGRGRCPGGIEAGVRDVGEEPASPETCGSQGSCFVLLNRPSDPSLSSFIAKCRGCLRSHLATIQKSTPQGQAVLPEVGKAMSSLVSLEVGPQVKPPAPVVEGRRCSRRWGRAESRLQMRLVCSCALRRDLSQDCLGSG